MDMAASVQKVTNEIVLRMARTAQRLTGAKHLCLAGGVALNCVANGLLLREKIFDNIWIAPAAGDAGGALGAALFVHHQLLENARAPKGEDTMRGALLGPKFSNDVIRQFLDGKKIRYTFCNSEEKLLAATVHAIVEQKVVGWFQDRMEFGPRALGARSIIGDARSPTMQSQMNLRIKFRESFRPFAPSVLAEEAAEYFELERESPYMLLVANVREDKLCPPPNEREASRKEVSLRDRVNLKRSVIPAVTHVDTSARIQTVDAQRNGRYYRLLRAFKEQTGCGVLINTSFNIRGEPIVCTPEDAYLCFMTSDMDVLVLENCILRKDEQPARPEAERQKEIGRFEID